MKLSEAKKLVAKLQDALDVYPVRLRDLRLRAKEDGRLGPRIVMYLGPELAHYMVRLGVPQLVKDWPRCRSSRCINKNRPAVCQVEYGVGKKTGVAWICDRCC